MGLPGAESIKPLITDTFTIVTSTVKEDSLRTDELSTIPLGSINNDPVFGSSSADYTGQFLLTTDNFSFGAGAVLDSVVLTMAYNGKYYGDLNSRQYLIIRELQEEIAYNSDYFSNSSFTTGSMVGLWQGNFQPSDSVKVNGLTKAPHLRIRLSDEFGKRMIASGKTWLDNPDFLSVFRGLVIQSQTTTGIGCQAYFDPTHIITAVNVYYNDSMVQPFTLYSNGSRVAARISSFRHKPTGQITQALSAKRNADTCYIQSQASCKLKLEIPYLFNLVKKHPESSIIIHGASLKISPLLGGFSNTFQLPEKLILVKSDSLGRNTPILDLYLSAFADTYRGGLYNSSSNSYQFNFLNEIQEVYKNYMSGKNTNYGYYVLIPGDNPLSAARLITNTEKLNGSLKFTLTYSFVR